MAWPLLEKLRAFVTREGWKDDLAAAEDIESEIASYTLVGLSIEEHPKGLTWPITGDPEQTFTATWTKRGAPFLRSRDAAALLEEAVWPHVEKHGPAEISFNRQKVGVEVIWAHETEHPSYWHPWSSEVMHLSEPVARTLAALEAGHKLDIWPIGSEDQ